MAAPGGVDFVDETHYTVKAKGKGGKEKEGKRTEQW